MRHLLLAATLTAASSASAATLQLQPGQTGRLGGQTVTVLRVQDSRCRPEVQCIQAGELRARLLVVEGQKVRLLTLTLPEKPNTPGEGLRITDATFGGRVNGKTVLPTLTLTDGRP